MVKKRVDGRVRGLIEHNVRMNQRSLFILVGDHGKDQVENLHGMLSKARVKSRPSVLWCYKKELGFSTHRKKRMQEIKKAQARGLHDADRDDPFDLFISSTNIRWTYYKESEKILGQTFGMCVLQDFEALTPNLLARTIETVEGGGIVVLLLKSVKSLTQLYTLTMDVHNRLRTEAHHDVVPRFNERMILSLSGCRSCLVLDDELNILPLSSSMEHLPSADGTHADAGYDVGTSAVNPELIALKQSLVGVQNVGSLVEMTRTVDQARVLMSFLDAVSERTLQSTVSLTAGRGRGKSASLGLCLAGAIANGYSNVFVTAPSPENLKTVFEFLIGGLKALRYTEHIDFEVLQEHIGEVGKVPVRINIFRDHRQTVQYILPNEHQKLAQAELVAIDEAAAIPLPTVKKLLGPYLVFMASTINGYEGTGRALSLKLIQQLRQQQGSAMAAAAAASGKAVTGSKTGKKGLHEDRWKASAAAVSSGAGARSLIELTLDEPIRYARGDEVESWLNRLLCLDVQAHANRLVSVMPAPKDCDLYLVDRDALFSYHSLSEAFLQRIWSLYTAAHYKNTPNDLQILSDAPAHRLFVLLGPQTAAPSGKKKDDPASQLPDVLCVVQVAFEGRISSKSVQSELSRGNKASGDLIPWTISQQFNDPNFAGLSGARVVRIATHPDVQKMGYGSRAIDLLVDYFSGKLTVETITPSRQTFGGEGAGNRLAAQAIERSDLESSEGLLNEVIKPRAKLPPLLTNILDRPAERLHYMGSSFGLTNALLGFWSRKGFGVVYLRQTANELTGEHSCIALHELPCGDLTDEGTPAANWLRGFAADYRRRMVSLMSYAFSSFDSSLSLTLLDPEKQLTSTSAMPEDDAAPVVGAAVAGGVPLTADELLRAHVSYHDLQRLELYARNMVDHHMILDLVPTLATLVFQGRLPSIRLSFLQAAILLSIGLQRRDVDAVAAELELPANQVLAFFNKTIRKLATAIKTIVEADTAKELLSTESLLRFERSTADMVALTNNLDDELQEEGGMALKKARTEVIMSNKDLSSHTVADAKLEASLKQAGGAIPKTISIAKDAPAQTSSKDKSDKKKNKPDGGKHHKKSKK